MDCIQMIRLILKTQSKDGCNGLESVDFNTYDIDNPDLEKWISQGGMSETGYLKTSIIGAATFDPDKTD